MKKTYDADELGECESKLDFDFHAHVLDRPNQFVVAAEEVANQSFLVFRTRSYID